MTGVAGAAAIATALVLLAAAATKARDIGGTAASFRQLHLPAPGAMAVAVPTAEALVAVLVLVRSGLGAWAAVGLLAAFTFVLLRAVVARLDVPCACFGSSRREPVSSVEVARNLLLVALAVVAGGARSAADADLPGVLVVAGAVTLGRLLLGLLDLRRRVGPVWSTTLPGERR